jgi:hypothetical protein
VSRRGRASGVPSPTTLVVNGQGKEAATRAMKFDSLDHMKSAMTREVMSKMTFQQIWQVMKVYKICDGAREDAFQEKDQLIDAVMKFKAGQ